MGKRSSVDYYARKQFRKKLLGVSILVFALALFASGLYLLTLLGPRPVSDELVHRRGEAVDVGPLRAELDALTDRVELAFETGEIDSAVLKDLDDAIALQRRIVTHEGFSVPRGVDTERIDRLRILRDQHWGEELFQASLEAENRGETAHQAGDTVAALAGFEEAARLQQEINLQHSRSPRRSTVRLSSLNDAVLELTVLPAVQSVAERVERARSHFAEGEMDAAKETMRAAIEAQLQINRDHRDTRYASLSQVQALERELNDLEAHGYAREVREMISAGRERLAEEDYGPAHARFQEALERQRTLNEVFPLSTFASRQAEEDLTVLVQTASSADLARRVSRIQEQVDGDLRARRVMSASSQVPALFREVQSLRDNFPRSKFVSEDLLLKTRYLNRTREDFSAIQDSVYTRLVEIPDHAHLRMFAVEVPQALYARIMATNPSTRPGDQLPVETVTQRDAMDFCERLGWLLARPVRLPTQEEFEAAIGSLRGVDVSEISWNSQNSDRETQVVGTTEMNAHGFHDLLGNVSEWTAETNPADPSEGVVVGGSVRDNPIRLNRMPVEYRGRNERNRLIGFRFVVDMTSDVTPLFDAAAIFAVDDDT